MMEMNKAHVYERAVEFLKETDYTAELRLNYSGRGMFGHEVPAIVSNAAGTVVGWAVMTAITEILDESTDNEEVIHNILFNDILSLIPKNSDNMGLSKVYY